MNKGWTIMFIILLMMIVSYVYRIVIQAPKNARFAYK